MDRVEQFVRVETHSILIGSLLLALLLLAAVVYLRNRKPKAGDTILLVGPSDGGKTAIFSSLVYNHAPQTHTSLQQNTALFRSPSPFHGRPLRIIDIPGHPRIRGQFADYLRGDAKSGTAKVAGVKGVVFVCDAAALTRNSSTVAEHLHLIMSAIANLPPSIPAPPILVFANKSDLLPKIADKTTNSGLALTRTQTILERELEKRRQASLSRGQTGAGGGVLSELGEDADTAAEGTALGGLDIAEDAEGPSFTFEKWEGGDIEVRSGWVDVKRKSGKERESDSEGESPVRGEKEKRGDGLGKLVEWVAALR